MLVVGGGGRVVCVVVGGGGRVVVCGVVAVCGDGNQLLHESIFALSVKFRHVQ